MNRFPNRSISPAQLCALMAAGSHLELLDVRTPPEFTNAHIPGARLIPLNDLHAEAYLKERQPGRPLFVICQAGGRARKAIEQFETRGCFDAVLVEGGTQAWIDAGLPVDRGVSRVLPLMRQVQIVAGTLSAIGAALAMLVSTWFALVPAFIGSGLLFAGLTGKCGMALLLARMPWNRSESGCIDLCMNAVKR